MSREEGGGELDEQLVKTQRDLEQSRVVRNFLNEELDRRNADIRHWQGKAKALQQKVDQQAKKIDKSKKELATAKATGTGFTTPPTRTTNYKESRNNPDWSDVEGPSPYCLQPQSGQKRRVSTDGHSKDNWNISSYRISKKIKVEDAMPGNNNVTPCHSPTLGPYKKLFRSCPGNWNPDHCI